VKTLGRILYGLALLGWAALYFHYARHRGGPIPGPPWMPGSTGFAWTTVIFFFVAGICLLGSTLVRIAAGAVAAALLLKFAGIRNETVHIQILFVLLVVLRNECYDIGSEGFLFRITGNRDHPNSRNIT
jgi:hypothetical protein